MPLFVESRVISDCRLFIVESIAWEFWTASHYKCASMPQQNQKCVSTFNWKVVTWNRYIVCKVADFVFWIKVRNATNRLFWDFHFLSVCLFFSLFEKIEMKFSKFKFRDKSKWNTLSFWGSRERTVSYRNPLF